MISIDDEIILISRSRRVLAEWWCKFNRWEWPDEFPNPEPSKDYETGGRRRLLMQWIGARIGYKECLRVWNL